MKKLKVSHRAMSHLYDKDPKEAKEFVIGQMVSKLAHEMVKNNLLEITEEDVKDEYPSGIDFKEFTMSCIVTSFAEINQMRHLLEELMSCKNRYKQINIYSKIRDILYS